MEKKSKLLLVAIIVAPVLLVGFFTYLEISSIVGEKKAIESWQNAWQKNENNFQEELQEQKLKEWIQGLKELSAEQRRDFLKYTGIGLLILAIPTLLTVIGERKNKRKMVLAAGIVYIFTVFGIPSAVLCFIANAKMKKLEAQ